MKKEYFLFGLGVVFYLSSCVSGPEPEVEEAVETEVVVTEEKEETTVATTPQEEEFVVTEEIYNKTFEDIRVLIEKLNDIIKRSDYETWLTFLTEEYITETSKKEYLSRWLSDPRFKDSNITIETLNDYFIHVVVPTRSLVKLDKIELIDDSSLYAYTEFKGEKYLLYYLVKTENGWKIGFY